MRAVVAATAATLVLAGCGGSAEEEPRPRPSASPSPAASDEPFANLSQDELDRRLIAASWKNDVRTARRLVAAGADVNAKDETRQSAYLISTSEGYLGLLELTLDHGADVDSLDKWNGTGLIRAAERGHHDVVGRLLQTDIDVDHVNNLGWVALHEAIVLGDGSSRYVDTVRALVAGGADVRVAPKRDGISPRNHARRLGFGRIATTLDRALEADRMTKSQANAALLRAAGSGDADAAAVAIRQGADLETRDGRKRTPLLLAAAADHRAAARLLVDLGADPDALDDRHDTPWLVTGVNGSVPMARIVAAAKPDYAILNRFGGTSAIPASERGHDEYVAWVVEHTSIDLDHVNDLGWTALLEAVVLGEGTARWQRIVTTLLEAGVDPSIADKDGVTALEHAKRRSHREIVRLLSRA
ncbi:ankyrin repeat domain-containing protein [Aeromicrobium terrae]|uniref:Ankyrin repeat domain-containing protein n=1 Tax=Aeromicrobium terrae TaxID=2498846 RepID=A0A5C8NIT6_9ACTN|nr:ankyrin repeat domain-containing protein [Aeromicrobium terrae]TXL61208.1 ankyrin repeat domain-containing protein [Aeromicrobium terrae]